jgi:prepilin-type N-terminal cleavage/methylation domain-containing protein
VTLRCHISDLQGEAKRAVLVLPGLLWLVVGWLGRIFPVRPSFYRSGTGVSPVRSYQGHYCAQKHTGGTRVPLRSKAAFTLMELLLVLALLAMAVAIAAPSLARFFQGRALDNEARRMLALTRYGQSRAVSEGVPMVMWFKPDENTYGLEAESTYSGTDTKAVQYQLDANVAIELAPPTANQPLAWKATTQIAGNQPAIRFTPDGYISETSPAWVWLKLARDDEPDAIWLTLSDNHLNYELQNAQPLANR